MRIKRKHSACVHPGRFAATRSTYGRMWVCKGCDTRFHVMTNGYAYTSPECKYLWVAL